MATSVEKGKNHRGKQHPVHAADLARISRAIRKLGYPWLAKVFDDAAKHVRSLR